MLDHDASGSRVLRVRDNQFVEALSDRTGLVLSRRPHGCSLLSKPGVLPALTALIILSPSAFSQTSESPTASEDEVRATIAEMLADAESRSSLLAGANATGGPDGFVLSSEDGAFKLRVGGYVQFRYYANFRDDNGGTDDFEPGFKIQRTRFIFSGTVNKDWEFLLLPYAGPDGSWSLLDSWVRYTINDHWKFTMGQFKLPFWREWLVSERFIFPVERSQLTSVYSSIYAQGVQLDYQAESFRGSAAFSDGLRSFNTDFNSPGEADYAFTGRIEWLAKGAWKQFADHTSLGNNGETGLMFGLAGHYQGETPSFRGVEVDRLFQFAADVSAEGDGWSVHVAGLGRWLDAADLPTEESFGVLAQGGVFVTEKTELFARYEVLIPDDDFSDADSFNAVTVGFNQYIAGHSLKFTLDGVYFIDAPNDVSLIGFGADTGTGLLGSTEDGQFVLRAQFQIIF